VEGDLHPRAPVFHLRSIPWAINHEVGGATLKGRTAQRTNQRWGDEMEMTVKAAQSKVAGLRALAPVLVGNAVLPYVIYLVLGDLGLSTMTALTASAIPPLVLTVVTALRGHRLDALGILSLTTIAIAIGTSVLTGNARFMIAKDGLFPLILGTAMLVSLVVGKTPIFHLMRRMFAGGDPAVTAKLASAWRHEGYRHALRRYTALAGLALLGLVAVQVTGAFTLPIGFALPALNVVQIVVATGLVVGIRTALRKVARTYETEPAAQPVAA
jgi:intracellular septation protein A